MQIKRLIMHRERFQWNDVCNFAVNRLVWIEKIIRGKVMGQTRFHIVDFRQENSWR